MANIIQLAEGVFLESIPSFSEAFGQESEEVVASTLRGVISSGGCYVLNFNEAAKAAMAGHASLSLQARQSIAQLPVGQYIQVFEELFEKHSAQERQAVIEHELGHVRRGHLLDTSAARTELGFIDRLEFELEADSDASRVVGKAAMRGGLLKSIYASTRLQSKVLAVQGIVSPAEELYRDALVHPDISARLRALT